MNGEAKKLQLIGKLLAVSDEAVLAAVDAILIKADKATEKRESFKDLAGKLNEGQLKELELLIEEGCEQINPNDWK
jgi:hypothetical protein